MLELVDLKRAETAKALAGIDRCKAIARNVKKQRIPPQASFSTPDFPSKDICDALVDCYLRSTESIFRILHVPTFRQAYEAIWVDNNTTPSTAFMVQLSLVLALGATTYDDLFSLRTQATHWVCTARTWLALPRPKADQDIPSLQTDILYLLAQERVGVAGDSPYILVGTMLRKAMFIGLHRDPSYMAPRTVFVAEMRRRIWNTILELALQASLATGCPPLLSIDDFDTAPPGNFEDEQLIADDLVPQPSDHFTQVSIAIVLRSTFPQRLAVVKFLNDLASTVAYEKSLQTDAELRAAYKSVVHTMLAYKASHTRFSPSQYEMRLVELFVHRFFLAIHSPYFGAALQDSAYAFTRKIIIETSLKVWRAVCPIDTEPCGEKTASETKELRRLMTNTSGFFPIGAIHAALLIALELRTQLKEEKSLNPVPLRPDLLSVLHESTNWCLQAIKAGETNVKGYLLMCGLSTQIEGLMRGLGEEEIASMMITAFEKVEEECAPILNSMLTGDSGEQNEDLRCDPGGKFLSGYLDIPMDDLEYFVSTWRYAMPYPRKIPLPLPSNEVFSRLIYFLTLATLIPWAGLSTSTARWEHFRLSLEIEILA